MNFNEQIAKQIITERVAARSATRRPTHPKTAGMLRRLAERMEGRT
jgi:hypothetical protein